MSRGIILAALLLAGCATAPAPVDVKMACVPLRAWTPAEQNALADALMNIPHDSVLWVLELDWQAQRDAIRAACPK